MRKAIWGRFGRAGNDFGTELRADASAFESFFLRIFDPNFVPDFVTGALTQRRLSPWADASDGALLVFAPAPPQDSPDAAPVPPTPTPSGDEQPQPQPAPQHRSAIGLIGGGSTVSLTATFATPATGTNRQTELVILYSDDLASSLVMDPNTRQLLTGGAGDWLSRLDGRDDLLVLSGDYSGGATLPGGIDAVRVGAGSSYQLTGPTGGIGRGGSFSVSGLALGSEDSLDFDGSAETAGSFVFHGGAGADRFLGGAGDDIIYGLGGGDVLGGGGGRDTFAYTGASDSTGANFDTLLDFDPGEDRIDLPGSVSGWGEAVTGGSLSDATFDADLAAALGSGLGAGQAMLFTPDEGDHAGRLFLIVDANGEEGYQAGEDYVFALDGTAADALGGTTDFFI